MRTIELYCTNAHCEGVFGVEVGWYEGSYDPPHAPEPDADTCPYCGYELVDSAQQIHPDELEDTLSSSVGYSGPLNIARDVNLNKVLDVIHEELRRQEREKFDE